MVKAKDLKPGMLIDLEICPYIHPEDKQYFFSQYAVVVEIEQETPDCVCVYIEDGDAFGCPTDYEFITARVREGNLKD